MSDLPQEVTPLAGELNQAIEKGNPLVLELLSRVGRALFFPKGILAQSAEAKQKADPRFNATIGMANENKRIMHLAAAMDHIRDLDPETSITYASSFGLLELRQAWQKEIRRKNPSLARHPVSLPVVTAGITHGLSTFADLFIDKDDWVVAPDKMWGNYNLIMGVRRGAKMVQFPFVSPQGGFNLPAFEQAVGQIGEKSDKILVLLNFPNNPTGYTPTEAESDGIAKILANAAKKGARVAAVCDDSYFGLRYDESAAKESIFARLCQCHPGVLAVKLDGATKELFVWGLRVCFITFGTLVTGDPAPFYEALERKTAGDIRGAVSSSSHLGQRIVLDLLNSHGIVEEYERKKAVLKERADEVRRILSAPEFAEVLEPYPFNSGYFMCLRLKTADAEALRVLLLDKYGVGTISLGKTDLRVAFSSVDKEDLRDLFQLILTAIKELSA